MVSENTGITSDDNQDLEASIDDFILDDDLSFSEMDSEIRLDSDTDALGDEDAGLDGDDLDLDLGGGDDLKLDDAGGGDDLGGDDLDLDLGGGDDLKLDDAGGGDDLGGDDLGGDDPDLDLGGGDDL
ncbi:MAG: hypothetical protein IIC64_10845, partial [SAR324 cluster bacterium]|nr:hypothetical protein [SAR324 cluster bacterium]